MVDRTTPYVMAVTLQFPPSPYGVRSVRQIPAGKINYGSNGKSYHHAGEMLKSRTGIHILHVPYKASPQVVTDVIGGRIEMMFNSVTLLVPHVQAGKLQALGVASSKRSTLLMDVPTFAESGFSEFNVQSWYGLVAPAGTPRHVVAKLHQEIARGVRDTPMHKQLVAMGTEPVNETTAQFGAMIKDEIARYGRVIKSAGVVVQ